MPKKIQSKKLKMQRKKFKKLEKCQENYTKNFFTLKKKEFNFWYPKKYNAQKVPKN